MSSQLLSLVTEVPAKVGSYDVTKHSEMADSELNVDTLIARLLEGKFMVPFRVLGKPRVLDESIGPFERFTPD